MPGSLQIVSNPDGSANGAYSAGDRTLRVRLGQGATSSAGGTLNPGQTAIYTFLVQLTEDAAGTTFSNVATLDYTVQDINDIEGYPATAPPVTVVPQADVSITKGMTPSPGAAGGTITSVLTVVNSGPSAATDVTVTDPVQAGMAWSGAVASNGADCSATPGSPFSCNLGTIPDGGSVTVTLTATTDPNSSSTQLANTASVSATEFDPNLTNNLASTTIPLTRQADLSIQKAASGGPIVPGAFVDYTLTVRNLGPSTAQQVTVSDIIPADSTGILSLVSATSSSPGVSCATVQGSGVSCSLASLAPNPAPAAPVTITVRARVAATANAATTPSFRNTATVSSQTPDPVTGNNSAEVTTSVADPVADVRLQKVVGSPLGGTVVAGNRITYLVSATNWGPSTAAGVEILDVVPEGVTATSVTGTRGQCQILEDEPSAGRQTISCTAATLAASGTGGVAAGASLIAVIIGVVDADTQLTSITNAADVTTSGSTDNGPSSNNHAEATIQVATSADLAVEKSSSEAALPTAGQDFSYTITVRNLGPSTARDVQLTDLVPNELDYVDVELPSGFPEAECDPGFGAPGATAQPWDCSLGDLEAGDVATIVLHVSSPEAVEAEITQEVAVRSGDEGSPATPDPVTGNNESSWTHSGLQQADLSIVKEAVQGEYDDTSSEPRTEFLAGETATYKITVTNLGPDAASNPEITDILPEGLSYVGAVSTTPDASCDYDADAPEGPTIVCEKNGDLEVGDSCVAWITVMVSPDYDTGDLVSNTVTVEDGGGTQDPVRTNNSATAVVPIVAEADIGVTDLEFRVDQSIGSATIESAAAGEVHGITMTVTNTGSATAKDVRFVLALEDLHLGLQGVDVAGVMRPVIYWNGYEVVGDTRCELIDAELVCQLRNVDSSGAVVSPDGEAGSLGPSQSVVVGILFGMPPDADPDGSGLVRVNLTTPTAETTTDNNEDTDPLGIDAGVTALLIDKTAVASDLDDDDAGVEWVAGGVFEYDIVVQRAELSNLADATNVVVTDVLPVGLHADSASAAQGDCEIQEDTPAAGRQTVVCELGTIPGGFGAVLGDPVTVRISGTVGVSIDGGTIIDNTATATTDTTLLDPETETELPEQEIEDSASMEVIEIADYRMFKATDQPLYYAGGSVGYTLTILNAGPSDAEQARIVDELPIGLVFDPAASDPSCSVTGTYDETISGETFTGQLVACGDYPLAVGGTRSVRLVATTSPFDLRDVDPDDGDGVLAPEDWNTGYDAHPRAIDNAATAGSAQTTGWFDPDLDNNEAEAEAVLDKLVDLSIAGGVSTTTPVAGGTIVYTAVASNSGPSAADHVGGAVTFPPGFVLTDWDVPFNDCVASSTGSGLTVQWTLSCSARAEPPKYDVFEPGLTASPYSYELQIPADLPAGVYTAAGFIETETPESDYTNNSISIDVYVQHVSDTSAVKTLVEPNPMVAGEEVSWRITVTNDGPSVAENTVVSDFVPAGMSYVSGAIEGGGPDCLAPDNDSEEAIVRCQVGALGVGESASALLVFLVGEDMGGTELCNEALVGSGSLDPDSADNLSEACGTAAPPPAADVGVTIAGPASRVDPGSEAAFTVTVRNDGPVSTTNVVVTLDVPPGLEGATGALVTAPDGSTAEASCTGSLVCEIGPLGVGEEVVYLVTGIATGSPGSGLSLEAAVTHDRYDPNPANDTASASVLLSGGGLALTGGTLFSLLLAALAALVAGLLLVLWARRLRRARGGLA